MGVLEVNKIWGKGSAKGWDFGRQEGVRNQMVNRAYFQILHICLCKIRDTKIILLFSWE